MAEKFYDVPGAAQVLGLKHEKPRKPDLTTDYAALKDELLEDELLEDELLDPTFD